MEATESAKKLNCSERHAMEKNVGERSEWKTVTKRGEGGVSEGERGRGQKE